MQQDENNLDKLKEELDAIDIDKASRTFRLSNVIIRNNLFSNYDTSKSSEEMSIGEHAENVLWGVSRIEGLFETIIDMEIMCIKGSQGYFSPGPHSDIEELAAIKERGIKSFLDEYREMSSVERNWEILEQRMDERVLDACLKPEYRMIKELKEQQPTPEMDSQKGSIISTISKYLGI